MDGRAKGVSNPELHESCQNLGNTAHEDRQAERGIVRTNGTTRVGVGKPISNQAVSVDHGKISNDSISLPSAALIEAQHEGGDGESEQAKGPWVCQLIERRVGDLRDGD